MNVEQPAELNRYVDSSIPLTWAWRWARLRIILPLYGFAWFCFLEICLVRMWGRGVSAQANLLPGAVMLVILTLAWLGFFELMVRVGQRSGRKFELEEDGIRLPSAKGDFFPWRKFSKIQFEPIAEVPEKFRMNLFLKDFPRQRPDSRVFWMMVVDHAQMEALVRGLRAGQAQAAGFKVEVLDHPLPPAVRPQVSLTGMSVMVAGMWFLLHGLPIMYAIFLSTEQGSNSQRDEGLLDAAHMEQAILWAKGFFSISNADQFRHLFITAGAILTLIGCGLMFWGSQIMKRSEKLAKS